MCWIVLPCLWASTGVAFTVAFKRAIGQARRYAARAGIADRVNFSSRNVVGDDDVRGRYDLITIFEALHDLPQPVAMLATMREMLAAAGSVLVMDERVADRLAAPGDDVERMMYGWSFLVCLPAAMTEMPSAATGTMMRADLVRAYAKQAG